MMMNEIKNVKGYVQALYEVIEKIMSYNSNKYTSGSKCNLTRQNLQLAINI